MTQNRRRHSIITVTYKSGRVERHHASGEKVRDDMYKAFKDMSTVVKVVLKEVKG